MTSFEYVMVLISIIVGLGITHLLSAMGAAIHRLRGHGRPIRLDAVYLSWIGFVFLWLIAFWWWEFRLATAIQEWTFGVYLIVILYAVLVYLITIVLLPAGLDEVDDSRSYFMSIRKWFFALLLAGNAFDVTDSFLKGFDWGARPLLLATVVWFTAVGVIGILSANRAVHLTLAIGSLAVQTFYAFAALGQIA